MDAPSLPSAGTQAPARQELLREVPRRGITDAPQDTGRKRTAAERAFCRAQPAVLLLPTHASGLPADGGPVRGDDPVADIVLQEVGGRGHRLPFVADQALLRRLILQAWGPPSSQARVGPPWLTFAASCAAAAFRVHGNPTLALSRAKAVAAVIAVVSAPLPSRPDDFPGPADSVPGSTALAAGRGSGAVW